MKTRSVVKVRIAVVLLLGLLGSVAFAQFGPRRPAGGRMANPPEEGTPQMVVTDNYVYVLKGDQLFCFTAGTLKRTGWALLQPGEEAQPGIRFGGREFDGGAFGVGPTREGPFGANPGREIQPPRQPNANNTTPAQPGKGGPAQSRPDSQERGG